MSLHIEPFVAYAEDEPAGGGEGEIEQERLARDERDEALREEGRREARAEAEEQEYRQNHRQEHDRIWDKLGELENKVNQVWREEEPQEAPAPEGETVTEITTEPVPPVTEQTPSRRKRSII